jgi:hypothetical protein
MTAMKANTETTGQKQSGRFVKGQSGNPRGRPKGARNTTTVALETLLDGQAQALTQKAIDLALAGDITALRLCLDRILPVRKDRPFCDPAAGLCDGRRMDCKVRA